jgi:glycosyltransferase involved in cell wall biosynthesis
VTSVRVLQVNKFVYRRGGAEGYMLDLATLLRDDGHTVEFFGMQHPRNDDVAYASRFPTEVAFDADAVGLAARSRSVARMMWSSSTAHGIAAVIDDFRPDVIHAHNVYHQLSPSVLRPGHRRGIPTVMTAHDYKLVCPTYQLLANGVPCEACLPKKFHRAVSQRCRNQSVVASGMMALELSVHTALGLYDAVDVFLCPSEFLRTMLERGGIPAHRLHLLRNFADPRDLGHPPKPVPGSGFLAAGRLAPEKGFDLAIRAVAAAGPDIRLRIAGEGPDGARLRTLANELAPGQVEFLGWCERATVAELLRRSAAALVTSTWYENQPLAVLEAFASRTPVIATRIGGLTELVEDGTTGLLVAPGDVAGMAGALRRIQDDPEGARRMGDAAATYVRRVHNPRDHVDELLEVYARAASVRARASR